MDKTLLARDQQKVLDMYKRFSDHTNDKVKDYKLNISTKLRKMDYENDVASTHYNFTQFLKVTLVIAIIGIIGTLSYSYLKKGGIVGIAMTSGDH